MSVTLYSIIRDASAQLGLRFSAVADGLGPTISVPAISTWTTDDQRLRFAFMSLDSGTDYTQTRLVISTDVSADEVVVQTAFTNAVSDVDFFLILSPDEWLVAASDYIQGLYYIDWLSVPLVAGQNEYDLTAAESWLTRKSQIISMRYRNTATSGSPLEVAVPAVFVREDVEASAEVLTAILHVLPSDISNVTLQVQTRHYHKDTDSNAFTDGIQLPAKLLTAGIKWAGLKLIYNKLGPQAKRNFGQAMVLAERDVTEQEKRFQNHTVHKDWQSEEDLQMGNVDGQISWGW